MINLMNSNSDISTMPLSLLLLLVLIALWSIFWKGIALWNAAKHHDKKWFVIILVLNTFGILELIYLFGVKKSKWDNLF